MNQRSLSLWRKNSVRDKNNSVRNKNSSVRDKNNSVREKENSVRNKNSVRIKSTRGVNISRYETDTTSTLRITLRPDTVFVPYTHHIRSDTIVVPDRICNEKLKQSKFMNIILLIFLTLFVATIIYRKIFHKWFCHLIHFCPFRAYVIIGYIHYPRRCLWAMNYKAFSLFITHY